MTLVSAKGTITPAQLTVAADNKSREYGLANPALTGTISGLVGGDTTAIVSGIVYKTRNRYPDFQRRRLRDPPGSGGVAER